jgi:hypothetical protein
VPTDTTVNTGAYGIPMRAYSGVGAGLGNQQVLTIADANGNVIGSHIVNGAPALDVNLAASAGSTAAAAGTIGTAVNSAVSNTAVGAAGNGTIFIIGGNATTGGMVAFEGSYEGTNWFPLDATRSDGFQVPTGLVFPISAVWAYNFVLTQYTQVRVRVTTALTGTAPTIVIGAGPFLWEPSPVVPPIDGSKPTYSAALNVGAVASATAATDFWALQNPSGSGKLIRVLRLNVQLTLGTAAALTFQMMKRSTLNTGGTSTAQTAVAHDSGNPAVSGLSLLYTAGPTLGTAIAAVRVKRMWAVSSTLAAQPNEVEWYFGNRPGQGILLRPAQQLSLYTSSAPGTAPTVTGDVEWTEEAA